MEGGRRLFSSVSEFRNLRFSNRFSQKSCRHKQRTSYCFDFVSYVYRIYLSGFLLPAMLQLMAHFALLWFHNGDWLFEYWSRLSDWWDDREVITESSSQVWLCLFAILPQEYGIDFPSLVVKCGQINSIAQISHQLWFASKFLAIRAVWRNEHVSALVLSRFV